VGKLVSSVESPIYNNFQLDLELFLGTWELRSLTVTGNETTRTILAHGAHVHRIASTVGRRKMMVAEGDASVKISGVVLWLLFAVVEGARMRRGRSRPLTEGACCGGKGGRPCMDFLPEL
jgi:hypothetical protein